MNYFAHHYLNYRTSLKLASCGLLVLAADFLFYKESIGWTLGIFGALLLIAIRMHQCTTSNGKSVLVTSCAALGLVFALIETPSSLAVLMYGVSIIGLALLPKMGCVSDARTVLRSILRYAMLTGWGRIFRDSLMLLHVGKRRQKRHGQKRTIVRHWLLPIGMSLVFVLLFGQANPIITQWLEHIQWNWVLEYFSIWRVSLWMVTAAVCWALIRPKFKSRAKKGPWEVKTKQPFTLTALLFNERSIRTSLVLFNGLFLIQNALDVAFLWSGAELPQGMTHAQYAHQGAYPLIATALLAALFVLIALKPGSPTEQLPTIRALVYGWVGQNVFLVFSSILRLLNYVEEYSLTYLRVEALIWMGLVAFGLMLIVARIYFRKNNPWLINANSLALYVTLYLCCFINFDSIIAQYNVHHCREITGTGAGLDTRYLSEEIGPSAVPALQWFEQHAAISFQPSSEQTGNDFYSAQKVPTLRQILQKQAANKMQNWRTWTFRDYRIAQQAGEQ